MLAESLFPGGWQHYLIGGLWIGAAAAMLFLMTGSAGGLQAGGAGPDAEGSAPPYRRRWMSVPPRTLVFAVGLLAGAALWSWLAAPSGPIASGLPCWQLFVGGLLAGFGARMSCGAVSLPSLAAPGGLRRRLLAALAFLSAAGAAAQLTWWIWAR